MPIQSLDSFIAGFRPALYIRSGINQQNVGVKAVAFTVPLSSALNGATLSSSGGLVAGQIPHYNPATGNAYLARLCLTANQTTAGSVVLELCDRIWHNGGFTSTSTAAQSITSPAWPARFATSASDDTPSTNGYGAQIALYTSAFVSGSPGTVTVIYTNSSGVAGRTATSTSPTLLSGSAFNIPLQAGDVGVRSIQSVQFGTSSSNTYNLIVYRPIATMMVHSGAASNLDVSNSGMPRIYDGAVPFLFSSSTTSSTGGTTIEGSYVESWG
jgi:hypothetical protein